MPKINAIFSKFDYRIFVTTIPTVSGSTPDRMLISESNTVCKISDLFTDICNSDCMQRQTRKSNQYRKR